MVQTIIIEEEEEADCWVVLMVDIVDSIDAQVSRIDFEIINNKHTRERLVFPMKSRFQNQKREKKFVTDLSAFTLAIRKMMNDGS